MSNESFLARIVAHKRAEVAERKKRVSLREMEQRARAQTAPKNFRAALTAGHSLAVIAEMKKASPSAGLLREDFVPSKLAQSYAAYGAAALSILTEEAFFHGSLEHVQQARAACELPLLRKDFLLDPYQLLEARAHGADAALLIVAMLAREQLAELLAAARAFGLQVLVETHTAPEIETALHAGAEIIGINNRDLATFTVEVARAEKLARLIPKACVRVAESGIASRREAERMAHAGCDAILVGSHFMRQTDPGKALAELIGVLRV